MENYRAFHFKSIGASHLSKGTVCQDACASVETDAYRLAVVCDGHGGNDYFRSDRGSRLATQAFCECVDKAFYPQSEEAEAPQTESFLKNKAKNFAEAIHACTTQKQIEEQLLWFTRSVLTRWNLLVEEDLQADPFREEELATVSEKARNRYLTGEKVQSAYGSTLIGVVLTPDFWFGIHIGDGKCVAFDREGLCAEPIAWDEQCFLNVTTSLCDSNALQEFRFCFSRELPAAVFVASDGIDDCFAGEKRLHNFYRVILTSFATEEPEVACRELEAYLPVLSSRGSGDDMSVGAILNLQHIRVDPSLYEKKKEPWLRIYRAGNLGAKQLSEDYLQKKEIPAMPGMQRLDLLGCGGFGKGHQELDILSVEETAVTLRFAQTQYTVTPQQRAEIHFDAGLSILSGISEFDTVLIQCFMK